MLSPAIDFFFDLLVERGIQLGERAVVENGKLKSGTKAWDEPSRFVL